jgi:acetyl-CoA carboxylase biotin carboxylase subunit
MLEKVLVANRGEIAARIIYACREHGIASVAVYSEPDRLSPHVLLADEAVPIGPAPASESYLKVDRIIGAARRTGAGAVHPGYGFLAENAEFAAAVEDAGLVFIGPPAGAIAAMGDKTAARARMESAGVPVVPGSAQALTGEEDALATAERIGYPVMLKAAAGGGGKGMRIATDCASLRTVFPRAESEARQAFGDARLYVERFLAAPRHIEIQVMADAHGRVVHLGERECSVQRRHQKLIEEAPSPVIDPGTRSRMGDVAVRAAEAVGYRSAGTVEFLYQNGEFFFLEMNTRIQVEHPITELVTGVDLVREQLRIAEGHGLSVEPDPEWPRGHAIECRISAEDPLNEFFPSTGRIEVLRSPAGPGVRWDSGVAAGFDVGLDYDPLLAKLIVHGEDRQQAIERMRRALQEMRVVGVATTQAFHLAVMTEPDFLQGAYTIRYVEEHPELRERATEEEWQEAALAAAVLLEEEARHGLHGARGTAGRSRPARQLGPRMPSAWQRALDSE